MTDKELESLKKKSLMVTDFSPNTKTSIVTIELNKLNQNVRKCLNSRKTVTVLILTNRID
jgi:hypothetical protein